MRSKIILYKKRLNLLKSIIFDPRRCLNALSTVGCVCVCGKRCEIGLDGVVWLVGGDGEGEGYTLILGLPSRNEPGEQ